MSMIKVSNLTFNYESHHNFIFKNVSFVIDTNWKLGFIGRNFKIRGINKKNAMRSNKVEKSKYNAPDDIFVDKR